MIYLDNNNQLQITEDPQQIAVESCFQELRLWFAENPLDIESGVDYEGVFNQSIFLKQELQRVCDRHAKNFRSIEVGDPSMGNDEIVHITIKFYLLSNEEVVKNLAVRLGG